MKLDGFSTLSLKQQTKSPLLCLYHCIVCNNMLYDGRITTEWRLYRSNFRVNQLFLNLVKLRWCHDSVILVVRTVLSVPFVKTPTLTYLPNENAALEGYLGKGMSLDT